MPDSAHQAVFLSYAREDTDAARRIAEALRSHGVEVWFDQNELRGGDAWDQKIRKQIADCSLFVPIVSKHTQERNKGYFRLEWKLAIEQTHLMLEGVPFLAPVVIDDTPDADAAVPAEFMRVQWTRLPGALPTPQFVEQVKRLLDAPPTGARFGASGMVSERRGGSREKGARSRTPSLAVVGAVAVVAILVVAYFALRPRSDAGAQASNPEPKTQNSKPMDLAAAKSIAVLPFTNMSDDRDSGFFADGVHEDVLTSLYLIPDLKVTSRQSVAQYRDTKKNMRQIGQELGVTHILEGSVRRDGQTVRVTSQLIRAASDEHLWAKRFDKELKDVFAIQSELAQAIATELQAKISPQAKKILERRPTENPAAYDLFIKARQISDIDRRRESLLQAAVVLDPNFALAWGDLTYVHGWIYINNNDHSAARLGKAKAAIDTAIRLAPDAPEVILNLGYYYYFGHRDYSRAIEQFEKVASLQPNAPAPRLALSLIKRRQGKWAEALEGFRSVAQLDPANTTAASQASAAATAGRRWELAVAERRRMYGLIPNPPAEARTLARLAFSARGSTREMEDVLTGLPAGEASTPYGLGVRMELALMRGDLAEIVRVDRLLPVAEDDVGRVFPVVTALTAQGDLAAARARLEKIPSKLRARIELEAENAYLWSELGMVEALLGHKEEALRCARKAVELVPESVDASAGPNLRSDLAFVQAWTGDKESALAEYTRLLRIPVWTGGDAPEVNVHMMKRHPNFFPLQGDPRFQALLNDPKNNAPLF